MLGQPKLQVLNSYLKIGCKCQACHLYLLCQLGLVPWKCPPYHQSLPKVKRVLHAICQLLIGHGFLPYIGSNAAGHTVIGKGWVSPPLKFCQMFAEILCIKTSFYKMQAASPSPQSSRQILSSRSWDRESWAMHLLHCVRLPYIHCFLGKSWPTTVCRHFLVLCTKGRPFRKFAESHALIWPRNCSSKYSTA